MEKLVDLISANMSAAFVSAGFDASYGVVGMSNRPDLCQFQCNGSLAAAKRYKKAPIMIANQVLVHLDQSMFCSVEAVNPGFINLKLEPSYLSAYLCEIAADKRHGLPLDPNPKTVIIDYGGPNVAKPLHVGHLRSAIIGESIKRIEKHMGNQVIGDIHLGDWGLQIGLIITELKIRKPELPYFDENYQGDYPNTPPFTIWEL